MKTSQDRILTTHVGSLPRPQEVVDFLFAQDRGEPIDPTAFDEAMGRGVSTDSPVRPAQFMTATRFRPSTPRTKPGTPNNYRTRQRTANVGGAERRGHFFAPPFVGSSPSLSLSLQPRRTVLAVKGSLRRAQQRRALDGSGPF